MLQGVLEALVRFMLNLEHTAVLLALCNTKKAAQNNVWRKQRYGQIVRLLQSHLNDYASFGKQVEQVINKMWASLPAVQQPGVSDKAKLHLGSAIQRLDLMHLYVDSKADEIREENAECKVAQVVSIAEAEAAAEAAAEAEAEAEAETLAAAERGAAAEGDTQADHEVEDEEQSQLGEEDTAEAGQASGAHARHTSVPLGSQSHQNTYNLCLHYYSLLCPANLITCSLSAAIVGYYPGSDTNVKHNQDAQGMD